MDSCVAACTQLAAALGPLGELLLIALAGAVTWWSRRQVRAARTVAAVATTKAETFETALRSIAPPATVEQALKAPRAPRIELRPSMPEEEKPP